LDLFLHERKISYLQNLQKTFLFLRETELQNTLHNLKLPRYQNYCAMNKVNYENNIYYIYREYNILSILYLLLTYLHIRLNIFIFFGKIPSVEHWIINQSDNNTGLTGMKCHINEIFAWFSTRCVISQVCDLITSSLIARARLRHRLASARHFLTSHVRLANKYRRIPFRLYFCGNATLWRRWNSIKRLSLRLLINDLFRFFYAFFNLRF